MNDVGSVPWLALVLFAPWFLILAGLYWWYPRQPRHAARRRFDSIALVIAFAGCLASLFWSFGWADRSHGPLWPQILATSIGYGAFLGLLGVAWWLRARVILARRLNRADSGRHPIDTRLQPASCDARRKRSQP